MCGFVPLYVFQFRLADPTNIANANSPDSPTPADRVVPIYGWRLVIVSRGLVRCLCASLPNLQEVKILSQWAGFVCVFTQAEVRKLRTKDPFARMVICAGFVCISTQSGVSKLRTLDPFARMVICTQDTICLGPQELH